MAEVVDLTCDDDLIEQGWERRSILDEPRLGEVALMYEEMGLQVKVVKLKPDMVSGCSSCLVGPVERYSVVYTRGTVEKKDDELFD